MIIDGMVVEMFVEAVVEEACEGSNDKYGSQVRVQYSTILSIMIDNDPTALVARRLKQERQQRQWSLDELARQSGVSKAMLSKVERGEASPTAALLGRISGALGVTVGSLLTDNGALGARLVRAADQPVWIDPQTRYVRRQVSPSTEMPVQLVEVEMPAGQEVAYPASAYAFIRQLIWLLSGTLEFVEGEQTHRLAAGDCLELGPPADCVFRNPTAKPCRYLVVVFRR
jgi:transcriptional regulator with XRE-family HTH domain